MLMDEVKKYKTKVLIKFLKKKEDLEFDEDKEKIICNENINSFAFIDIIKKNFKVMV